MFDYTLGLDIGITSVGSCAIDQNNAKLIEIGVRKFEQADEAKTPRLKRSSRRTLRRKNWRKNQLLTAFDDFGIISSSEIGNDSDKNNYLNFYGKGVGLAVPETTTVYHLRKKALTEKVSKREILLCLYNILQARGNFLYETIDFSSEGVTFGKFKDNFYGFVDSYASLENKKDFEKNVLKKLFESKGGILKDLEKEIKNGDYVSDEDELNKLLTICLLIAGGKKNIGILYGDEEGKTQTIESLKSNDEFNEVQEKLIELYDLRNIAQILSDGCQYPCDIDVKKLDEYSELIKKGDNKTVNDRWGGISKAKNHIRSVKNISHSYPNGLYIKEASAMLRNQQRYYPDLITDEFIEVCTSIVSARIPYYIGPLGNDTKNGWAELNGKMKYSYDYTITHFKDAIDQNKAIVEWKKRMVSHCTYLPEEIAMPKGSFVAEIYSIISEINNYSVVANTGDYYLNRNDKIRVINELFLKKDEVTFDDLKNLLGLDYYGSKKGATQKFNNRITVYKQIANIIPELKLNDISQLFASQEKIDKIEDIILNISLFDEEISKRKYFENEFTKDQAKSLSKIKTNGFYSISRKFIMNTPINFNGDSIMDVLFADNNETTNNLQTILAGATDHNGEKIDFSANKYERIIREHNNDLTIDLIMDEGKPVIPISRPVIRALNEALKIYKSYVKLYGAPSRLVIETAKGEKDSIKDFTEQNGSPMKHFKKLETLCNYLDGQLSKKDQNRVVFANRIEEWEALKAYYEKNKTKIELYIRQNGVDLLTGKKIDIGNLQDYEIDHILPRGFGDDSQDDKMLCSKKANGAKGDRVPIEFLESTDVQGVTGLSVGQYEKMVKKLFEMKMISDKKYERLMLRNQDNLEAFINQNLVDTRYIISQFVAILNAYNKVNNVNTHIVCLNGSFTAVYRNALNFRKDRDLGEQHHAYDAACLCIADACLQKYYPAYDVRSNVSHSKKGNRFSTYSEFVNAVNQGKTETDSYDEKKELRTFIRYIFEKAYGQQFIVLGKEAPLLREIKSTVPLISWKTEKNYQGQFFDETLISPNKIQDNSVLSIIGVNNEKRGFTSVNCAAVDLYKIKGKHYAIHIPYLIIDKEGNINKEKYMALVKNHYCADDLIDENGELITKAFKMRLFKNDMIYDTANNELFLFNIGSITNKLFEFKLTDVFSYSGIYEEANKLRQWIIREFALKTKSNLNGKSFTEIDKNEIIFHINRKYHLINDISKSENHLKEVLENENNLESFTTKIIYFSYLANSNFTSKRFTDRILKAANNNLISKNPDAEYIKLKYNPLGIRFCKNEKGKLVVSGPRCCKNGGYSKIKKEEFSWTISRNDVK